MDHNYHFESKNIRRSIIVLSLSFVLVYVILFYAKWDIWKQDINDYVEPIIQDQELKITETLSQENVLSDGNSEQISEVIETQQKNNEEIVETNEFNLEEWQEENFETLSWTKTYYWELDFVDLLWISYNYALKDDKNIYYINISDNNYDFADIARKLWWNLYVMNTEQELLANALFGDKVTYINLPDYREKTVLMILNIDDQSWLLAIDYAIYHQVKPYLKNLFID